jgi:hypothetical protein
MSSLYKDKNNKCNYNDSDQTQFDQSCDINDSRDIIIHNRALESSKRTGATSSSLMNTSDMYTQHDNKYNMALHNTHREMVQQTFDLLSEQTSNKYENQIQTNVFYKSAQDSKHALDAYNTVIKDLCSRLNLPTDTILDLVEETKERNIREEERKLALKGILTLANKISDQIIHLTTSYKKLLITHPDISEEVIKTTLGKEYLYTIIKIELQNEKRKACGNDEQHNSADIVEDLGASFLDIKLLYSDADPAENSSNDHMRGLDQSTTTDESIASTRINNSPRESHMPSEVTLGL